MRKPLLSLALGAVLTMTSASAALAVAPVPHAGATATIPPATITGYVIKADPATQPPWNRPIPPATVTGYKIPATPAPQIGDAIQAVNDGHGGITIVRLGRRGFLL